MRPRRSAADVRPAHRLPDDLPPRVRPDERGTHDKPPPESEARNQRVAYRAGCACARGCSRTRFLPFPLRAQDESGNAAFPDFGNAPLLEWLTRPTVERAVKLRFARFLHRFTTPGAVHVYRHKLLDLCLSVCPLLRRAPAPR